MDFILVGQYGPAGSLIIIIGALIFLIIIFVYSLFREGVKTTLLGLKDFVSLFIESVKDRASCIIPSEVPHPASQARM
jgi:hypothetical protein